ncbi:MAG: 6-phosphogluconolactonase, partial [Pseudomonadota bacterium]
MAIAEFHMFDDREALAEGLANRLAQTIKLGIDENQFASVALSGGATPKAMLQRLGARLSADDRE